LNCTGKRDQNGHGFFPDSCRLKGNGTIAGRLAGTISSNGCLQHQEGRLIVRTRTERAQLKKLAEQVVCKTAKLSEGLERKSGPPETRTPDPLIKSQLLYQLS
jgi:hypothetical protein